jgi:uncharacterized membrane protein
MRAATALRWSVDVRVAPAAAASALAVVVLIGGPVALGEMPTHRFLLWNLALAWVPLIAAVALEFLDGRDRRAALAMWVLGILWISFLPNAPYLVSDLSHFEHSSATPWLDLARLVSFAWAGCLLGALSLQAVHRVVLRRAGSALAWLLVVTASLGSGFGVVLGRFSRLNSWQVVTAPGAVVDQLFRIAESGRSLAVALFFGLLLLTIYAAIGAPAASSPTS